MRRYHSVLRAFSRQMMIVEATVGKVTAVNDRLHKQAKSNIIYSVSYEHPVRLFGNAVRTEMISKLMR